MKQVNKKVLKVVERVMRKEAVYGIDGFPTLVSSAATKESSVISAALTSIPLANENVIVNANAVANTVVINLFFISIPAFLSLFCTTI